MYEDRKAQALETWQSMLAIPEIRATAQEQYEELLRLAEDYSIKGFINRDERKGLVMEATKRYAHSVEDVHKGA
ncbi:hypothetical protein D3C73_954250 [compost metagenome]